MTDDDSIRLGDTGQIYVTDKAWRLYARLIEGEPEESRRELTRLLVSAKPRPPNDNGTEVWRYRGRPAPESERVEVTASVVREDGLVLVVHTQARWNSKGRRDGETRR